MRFVFGFAGVPFDIYDAVYAARARIAGENGMFISEPLRSWTSPIRYTQSHANFFLRTFARLIKEDHHNTLQDTGFALVYVVHDAESTRSFARCFFPSTFSIGIEWALDQTSRMTIQRSKNELLRVLERAADQSRRAIPVLKKEITERDNRTPLLLPLRNFDSRHLAPEIANLQDALFKEPDKINAVNNSVQTLERHYPLHRPGGYAYRRFFVDDRRVEFEPPGKADARHAFARAQNGHPETCLLAGRRRLGAPYDHAFHYDCTKGAGNIRELFYGCHEERSMREGNPHLNIAPNDFVRG